MKIGRIVLINAVTALVIIGLFAVGYNLWYQSDHYVTTSNAQVTGNPITLLAPVTGQVSRVEARVGHRLAAGAEAVTLVVDPTRPRGAARVVPVPAPAGGTVIAMDVAPGQMVPAGEPLGTLMNLSRLWVQANVPETQIRLVHVGQSVDVSLSAYPSVTFKGRVHAIEYATQASMSLLPDTQSSGSFTPVVQDVPVIITLDSDMGHTLINGQSATVKIRVR